MNIDYTVTALMFPAIPLLMGVYSNRFHSLSILIDSFCNEHVYEKHIPQSGKNSLLIWWQDNSFEMDNIVCCIWVPFNMLTVFALYLDEVFLARVIFWVLLFIYDYLNNFFIREIQFHECT